MDLLPHQSSIFIKLLLSATVTLIFRSLADVKERFAGNGDDGSLIKCQLLRGAGTGSPRRIRFACGRIRPVFGLEVDSHETAP
jgi:hypothetical protein